MLLHVHAWTRKNTGRTSSLPQATLSLPLPKHNTRRSSHHGINGALPPARPRCPSPALARTRTPLRMTVFWRLRTARSCILKVDPHRVRRQLGEDGRPRRVSAPGAELQYDWETSRTVGGGGGRFALGSRTVMWESCPMTLTCTLARIVSCRSWCICSRHYYLCSFCLCRSRAKERRLVSMARRN